MFRSSKAVAPVLGVKHLLKCVLYPSVCLSVRPSVRPSVCLYIRLSVSPSVSQSVCLSSLAVRKVLTFLPPRLLTPIRCSRGRRADRLSAMVSKDGAARPDSVSSTMPGTLTCLTVGGYEDISSNAHTVTCDRHRSIQSQRPAPTQLCAHMSACSQDSTAESDQFQCSPPQPMHWVASNSKPILFVDDMHSARIPQLAENNVVSSTNMAGKL